MSLLRRNQATNSRATTKLLGYNAQTAIYGRPIAIVYGQNLVTGNVFWYDDWKANPVTQQSGGKLGGGKGSNGGKGGGSQQYTYSAALAIGLCQGPIGGLGDIWNNKVLLTLNRANETATIPSGGGTFTPDNASNWYSDLGSGSVVAYSISANDYGSPGATTLAGNQTVPLRRVTGTPGVGEYSIDEGTGVYTFGPSTSGLSVQVNYTWSDPNASNDGNPVGTLSFAVLSGENGQTPWSYLTSNHAAQALGYTGLAFVGSEVFDLGSTGVVPNFKFEVFGFLPFGAGTNDANVAAVIEDFLTNPHYGALFPAANLGNLTPVRNYSSANGIFISPVVDSQRPASEWLEDWLKCVNAAAVWSEGRLKFRPYGDKTVVGNGAIFKPDTSPVYELDETDFLGEQGSQKIFIDRPSIRTAENAVKIEWTNRKNGYATETVEEKDDYHIGQYGLRPAGTIQLPAITSQDVARRVAATILQRSVYIRTEYRVKLSAVKYALLEPLDLVTLTKAELGLNKTPARVKSISENDSLELEVVLEEFPWGTATPALYPKQTTGPFGPGFFARPGPVFEPLFFEAPPELTQGVQFELFIGLSGGNNWGGANVYVSTDGGNSYELIGVQNGPAVMGVLTADLPGGDDPDETNTLAIDLTQSGGELLSYSEEQRDNNVAPLIVGDEIISYKTATLTSPLNYDVSSLRRGVYGSTNGVHAAGSIAGLFNGQMFGWIYDQSVIGTTLYFKFASFNKAGQQLEDLANVTAWPYFVYGPRRPYPAWFGAFSAGGGAGANEQFHSNELFGIQQSYVSNNDGSSSSQWFLTAPFIPVNTFSKLTEPPVVSNIVVSTTGGSLEGGVVLSVAVWSKDTGTPAGYTDPVIFSVTIPAGTNTNKIEFDVALFDAGDTLYYSTSPNPMTGWFLGTAVTGATSIIIDSIVEHIPTGAVGQTKGIIPDWTFDHFRARAAEVTTPGIWTGPVESVVSNGDGTCTVTVEGTPFTAGALVGRVWSLIGTVPATSAYSRTLPTANVLISANTDNTITIPDLTASTTDPLVTVELVAGDIFTVRTKASTFTNRTIADSGLLFDAANDQAGKLLWIIGGTGKGQTAPIKSNTTGGLITLGNALGVTPDSSSVFIILNSSWKTTDSPSVVVDTDSFAEVVFKAENAYDATFMVQLVTVAKDGQESLMEFSPFVEIFAKGTTGGAAAQMTISIPGPLAVGSDLGPVAFFTTARSLSGAVVQVDQAPTGANAIFEIWNDTTSTLLWTITITAGQKKGTAAGAATVAADDRIRVDCIQTGSINPGGDNTGVALY